MKKINRIFGALIGNTMEFYDFTVYAFLTSYISKEFFHFDNPFLAFYCISIGNILSILLVAFIFSLLGSVYNCSTTHARPTFRGLSAESMDPADKPREVGVWMNCQQTLIAAISSTLVPIFVGIFPFGLRYSGLALSFNLSITCFSSSTPMAMLFFEHHFNAITAGGYVSFFAALVLFCTQLLLKRKSIFYFNDTEKELVLYHGSATQQTILGRINDI